MAFHVYCYVICKKVSPYHIRGMKQTLRPDFVFSIWIFIWFILYVFKVIPYNPTLALYIVVVFISISMVYFFYKQIHYSHIDRFIALGILQKFLPLLYLLYNNQLDISVNDIVFTIIVFITYNTYLLMNNSNIIEVYEIYLNSYTS
jgi:hypothetical protein